MLRKDHRVILLTLVLTVSCLIGGCGPPRQPVRLGLLVWPPYELVSLARVKGWLGDDIDILDYRSPSEMTRAFRNGLLDAVFVTSHMSLRLAATGTDHRIIYIIDYSRGGDALVAKNSITSLKQLKGKTIGTEPSALGVYVLERALDFAGLDRKNVDIAPVDVAEQPDRWRGGSVDAMVCYEPVKTELLRNGGHVLFDSNRIPDEISDILITHTVLLKYRKKTLQKFVRALARALDFYHKHEQQAIAIMASRSLLSPTAFRRTMSGAHLVGPDENRTLLEGSPPQLQIQMEKQQQFMQRNGLLGVKVDIGKLIDDRFVCEKCLP